MEVAKEILNQLGGQKFIAMTGSKNFVGGNNSLSMHLTRNKLNAKYLKIEQNSLDLYDLTFSTCKKVLDPVLGIKVDAYVEIKVINNIYCDQLRSIFENETGLYTSLGSMCK